MRKYLQSVLLWLSFALWFTIMQRTPPDSWKRTVVGCAFPCVFFLVAGVIGIVSVRMKSPGLSWKETFRRVTLGTEYSVQQTTQPRPSFSPERLIIGIVFLAFCGMAYCFRHSNPRLSLEITATAIPLLMIWAVLFVRYIQPTASSKTDRRRARCTMLAIVAVAASLVSIPGGLKGHAVFLLSLLLVLVGLSILDSERLRSNKLKNVPLTFWLLWTWLSTLTVTVLVLHVMKVPGW